MRKIAFASLWLLVFAIPWENAFTLPGLGTASRLFGLAALLVGVLAVLLLQEGIRLQWLQGMIFCFVLAAGFSYFWSIEPAYTLGRSWTYLQLLGMTWLVCQYARRSRDLHALLAAYVFGACLCAGSTVVSYLQGTTAKWQRYAALGFNPNDVAVILAIGIPMAWYLAQIRWRGWTRLFQLYAVLAPCAIALTGSRTGLIATLIALSYVLWTLPRLSLSLKLTFLVAGWLAVWVGTTVIPATSWERLATTRAEIVEGGWNSRLQIWWAGYESFARHPLVGSGAGTFRAAVEPFLGEGKASHNVYLAILVEQGLLGLALLLAILLRLLWDALHLPGRERGLWLNLLLIWGASAFAHPWEWRKQTWLLFALAAAHAASLREEADGAESVETVASERPPALCIGRATLLPPGG